MDRPLQKLLFITIFLSVFLTAPSSSAFAENTEGQSWQDELRDRATQVFHTEVKKSQVSSWDYIDRKEYLVTRIEGEGSLKKVSTPFAAMYELFKSDGWEDVLEYTADKPGSSQFAYRKGSSLCIVIVNEDTLDCDAEIGDFVPIWFDFSMDCRETK